MPENNYFTTGKLIEEAWFKDSPEGMVLVGNKCEVCNKVFFPKKEICLDCFDSKIKEFTLSKKGKLHTYTISYIGPSGMETPYLMGFIDLPEGIKLFSILTNCEPWDKVLKIGMEMEMVIGKIKQDKSGTEIIGYQFRPVD